MIFDKLEDGTQPALSSCSGVAHGRPRCWHAQGKDVFARSGVVYRSRSDEYATASAPALANALRGYIAMRGGSIQAQQLAEFYKSPACAGLEVPKGGALKLLRNVENSGLRFTHMPHLNKWIIALDHDAPPPPPPSDLGASAPAFVPGQGYAPVAEADLRFASADEVANSAQYGRALLFRKALRQPARAGSQASTVGCWIEMRAVPVTGTLCVHAP